MFVFVVGLLLGLWLGAAFMIVIILEPKTKKELSKEDWKAGYRQK